MILPEVGDDLFQSILGIVTGNKFALSFVVIYIAKDLIQDVNLAFCSKIILFPSKQ